MHLPPLLAGADHPHLDAVGRLGEAAEVAMDVGHPRQLVRRAGEVAQHLGGRRHRRQQLMIDAFAALAD